MNINQLLLPRQGGHIYRETSHRIRRARQTAGLFVVPEPAWYSRWCTRPQTPQVQTRTPVRERITSRQKRTRNCGTPSTPALPLNATASTSSRSWRLIGSRGTPSGHR